MPAETWGDVRRPLSVPVLMWHHIGQAPTRFLRPYAVAPDVLEAQLDAVVEGGYRAVTFDDLRDGASPGRPVVLTFDDGYSSFLEEASPRLLRRSLRAVIFVIAGRMGGVNDWDVGASALRLMAPEEVWAAAQEGHELGVHGWRHRRMPEIPSHELERELLAARSVLADMSGRAVRSLSYPHGEADDLVVETARRCGFDVACLDTRAAAPSWPPGLGVTRIEVTPETSPDRLLELLAEQPAAVAPASCPAVDPFDQLVRQTLAVADGHPPAAGWGAVHAAAGPLVEVLRLREVIPQRAVFAAVAAAPGAGSGPMAAAVGPLAAELDRRLDQAPPVPVWDAATPEAAGGVDFDRLRLGPPLSDPARLFWSLPPVRQPEAMASYLRGGGRGASRREVRQALEELTLADTALLAREALELGEPDSWSRAEEAFRRVRAGEPATTRPRSQPAPAGRRRARLRTSTEALVRQELRERYGGSRLGMAWSVASPLLTFAVLAFFFGKILRLAVPAYPQFLLSGLLPWVFIQRAVAESGSSVRGKGHLLRLSDFPRVALPLSKVVSALVDLAVQLSVAVPILALTSTGSSLRLLLLPLALALAAALASAGALFNSGLSVRYRDVAHLVPLLLSLGFYAVPVFYPPTLIPGPWLALYRLNPAAVTVEAFRSMLHGSAWPPAWALAVTVLTAAVALVAAWRWFERTADRFVSEA